MRVFKDFNSLGKIRYFLSFAALVLYVFASDWIIDNSGLRRGPVEQIELARHVAKGCVSFSTAFVFIFLPLYVIGKYCKTRARDHDE